MQQGDNVACFRFLAKMGLTSPSEPTKRNIGLAILGVTYTVDEVLHMSRANKVAFAETTYSAFLRTRALCPPASNHLVRLFPTVQEFRAHFPEWYGELYHEELPAMPPWPIETWSRMSSSGNCRKERGTSALRASGSFAAPAPCGSTGQMMRHLGLMQHEIGARDQVAISR